VRAGGGGLRHLVEAQTLVRVDQQICAKRNFAADVHTEQQGDGEEQALGGARHAAQSGDEARLVEL
jgi:hypothetical protein